MRLKTRIAKIEKKLPEKDREPIITNFIRGNAHPTSEEMEIAQRKALEVDPSSNPKIIFYQPFDLMDPPMPPESEHVKCYPNLGIYIQRNIIYKIIQASEDSNRGNCPLLDNLGKI